MNYKGHVEGNVIRLDDPNEKLPNGVSVTIVLENAEKKPSAKSFVGTWDDSRSAEEIIKDIKSSQTNSLPRENF